MGAAIGAGTQRLLEDQLPLADRVQREKGMIAPYVFFHFSTLKDLRLRKLSGRSTCRVNQKPPTEGNQLILWQDCGRNPGSASQPPVPTKNSVHTVIIEVSGIGC